MIWLRIFVILGVILAVFAANNQDDSSAVALSKRDLESLNPIFREARALADRRAARLARKGARAERRRLRRKGLRRRRPTPGAKPAEEGAAAASQSASQSVKT